MDIYEYAKTINYNADYYDMYTGYTYRIQDYGREIKLGLPTNGIAIIDGTGTVIAYAKKKESGIKSTSSITITEFPYEP